MLRAGLARTTVIKRRALQRDLGLPVELLIGTSLLRVSSRIYLRIVGKESRLHVGNGTSTLDFPLSRTHLPELTY
jgi:hypothetical protein